MKLLHKNTIQFNQGPDLAWVVQHAKLLVEAAEDAIDSRRSQFNKALAAIKQLSNSNSIVNGGPNLKKNMSSKRKRGSGGATYNASNAIDNLAFENSSVQFSSIIDTTNNEIIPNPVAAGRSMNGPGVGGVAEVWWAAPYKKWYTATITDKYSDGQVQLRYHVDNTTQKLWLSSVRWRHSNKSPAGTGRGKRGSVGKSNANLANDLSEPSISEIGTGGPPSKKRRGQSINTNNIGPSSPRSAGGGANAILDSDLLIDELPDTNNDLELGNGNSGGNTNVTINEDAIIDNIKGIIGKSMEDIGLKLKDQVEDAVEKMNTQTHRSEHL